MIKNHIKGEHIMKRIKYFFPLLMFIALPVFADEFAKDIVVKPNQAVIQVSGIVCSFCAYGTEKNVSKLDFLDASYFGDGVMIDIETYQLTVALNPKRRMDLKSLDKAIKDGGYDPLTIYFRLSGTVKKEGGKVFLTAVDSGQLFELAGETALEDLRTDHIVDVQAHMDATNITSMTDTEPIKVIVDKIIKEL